ncbi:hypothetical protein SAMD00079811_78180 (plasmid) [Scytonema sp. HK-05]|nr:hypothetical protein SAMD00079811_78180 [Scytonema sp. HK-05]
MGNGQWAMGNGHAGIILNLFPFPLDSLEIAQSSVQASLVPSPELKI